MEGRIIKNPEARRWLYIATVVVIAAASIVNGETAASIGALADRVAFVIERVALALAAVSQLVAAANVPSASQE